MQIRLFLCLLVFFKDNFHNKAKVVCTKMRSTFTSHSLKGYQGTKPLSVKWPETNKVIQNNIFKNSQSLVGLFLEKSKSENKIVSVIYKCGRIY